MSRHPVPAESSSAVTIPKELWYRAPVHTNVLPSTRLRLPMVIRLLPFVALVSGYTSALASTAHVGLACGAVRYAVASVRHDRSVTER